MLHVVLVVWPGFFLTMSCLGIRSSSIFNSQHVATRCNRVAKRVQRVVPNNVGICRVQMLRSFGRNLQLLSEQCWDMLRIRCCYRLAGALRCFMLPYVTLCCLMLGYVAP